MLTQKVTFWMLLMDCGTGNQPGNDMQQPTTNTLERLDEDQVVHLTLRQLYLLGAEAASPGLCENRTDGRHPHIGSSPPGVLVATRAGMICPVCSILGESHLVKVTSAEMEAATEAFFNDVPNTPQTYFTVQAKLSEWVEWEDSGTVLASLVVRPLANYLQALGKDLEANNHPGHRIDGFPLNLLLRVHNLAEHGSQIRKEILGWLETERALRPRNHWMDAITVSDDGELRFNNKLHTLAAWRGKQETYFKAAAEGFDKLKRGLGFVAHFQTKEDEVALTAPDTARLFPARPLERPVKELKAISSQLALLVEALEGKELAEVAAALQAALPRPLELTGGKDQAPALESSMDR